MSAKWMLGAGATMAAALLISSSAAAANAATPARTPERAAAPAPAKVADKLFRAWLRNDRKAAARVATPSAVTSVFSYPYRAPDEFAGCTANACRYVHTSVRVPGGLNGILMIVSGAKVTRVYQSRHITKPAPVARHLFRAWQKGDRHRALEVATKPVVDTLFRVTYDPKGVTYFFQGCTRKPKGYTCAYSYEGGALLLHLKGTAARGYDVRSIGYIAD